MASVRALSIACVASVLLAPASLGAQAKDGFVTGLVDFINAAEEPSADRHAALSAAVDAMAAGLAQWDSAIAKVEAGFASEVGAAPPQTAARMRTALGAVYLERGRFDAALVQFDAAATLDPSSPDVHVFRGLVFDQTERPGEAAEAYRRAWRSDPTSAINGYRFLRAAGGDAPSADVIGATNALRAAVDATAVAGAAPFALISLELLDDSSSATPIIPFGSFAEAFTLIRRGRYDEAVARFRDAVAATTSQRTSSDLDERARLAAADAMVASGNPAAARQALRETLRVLPNSRRAHWKLGTLLQALGDWRGAAEAFEAAAPGAVVGAGSLLATIGQLRHNELDLDAALAAYIRRAALRPNDSAAHYELADIYRARDDLDAALVEALAAALLDPNSTGPFVMIGQLDTAAGRDEDALRMLRRAVTLAPAHAEARYALSRALLRAGKDDEARRELAVFQQLQSAAIEAERRRFQENKLKIDEALKANPPGGNAR